MTPPVGIVDRRSLRRALPIDESNGPNATISDSDDDGAAGLCDAAYRLSGSPQNIWMRERSQRSAGSWSWAARQAMCSS